MLTLVAMADTHGYHRRLKVPLGDVLVHAGDLTQLGSLEEIEKANAFLAALPHRHKVIIAGNHDFAFQQSPAEARRRLTTGTYLEDGETTVEGLRVYGSPWQPWFFDWAFNLARGPEIAAVWERIPEGLDVLVTHGPPLGYGDLTMRGGRAGCADLLARVKKVAPRLHLFGHIHEAAGVWREGRTTFVNVTTSECERPPVVIRIDPSDRDAAPEVELA